MSNRPYIYASPSKFSVLDPYNGFDPKAVTRASYVPPRPRPKPNGPLIDFNRHPDSYLIRPYGQTKFTPMSPNTAKKVEILRWIQQGFRVLQMIGAIGMLMCTIFIRNTSGSQGPILRIPPIFDMVVTGYAIWHLLRSAKSRPPGSSASYHFFALVMDGGLVPFYVFIALITRSNMQYAVGSANRWTTIFTATGATNKVLLCTWVGAAVVGGLHVVSLCMSLYLCLIFRQISNLPPDMNPLEDNLTARPTNKHKHKYKNSELSSSSFGDHNSASTASLSHSAHSSPRKEMAATSRPVSFLNTRNKSDDAVVLYSPHNPRTAQASRTNLAMYHQPLSAQTSHVDLASSVTPTEQQQTLDSRSVSPASATPPVPRKSSKRYSSTSDNWKVHNNDENADPAVSVVSEESDGDGSLNGGNNFLSVGHFVPDALRPRSYEPVSQKPAPDDRFLRAISPVSQKHDRFTFDPLGMNPPTPRGSAFVPANAPLAQSSGNTMPMKKKFYGDLDSAREGIRRAGSPFADERIPHGQTNPGSGHSTWVGRPNYRGDYGAPKEPSWMAVSSKSGGPRTDARGRVISRSGADLGDGLALRDEFEDVSINAGLRGRNVSGKVAEEGRSGAAVWWR